MFHIIDSKIYDPAQYTPRAEDDTRKPPPRLTRYPTSTDSRLQHHPLAHFHHSSPTNDQLSLFLVLILRSFLLSLPFLRIPLLPRLPHWHWLIKADHSPLPLLLLLSVIPTTPREGFRNVAMDSSLDYDRVVGGRSCFGDEQRGGSS